MKKNKTFLAVLLGCVLAATAVAGGVAWNRSRNGGDEKDNTISLEETTGEYLWDTPTEESGRKTEAAKEPTTDTEEKGTAETEPEETETKETEPVTTAAELRLPETGAAETAEEAQGGIPAAMEQALALNFSPDSRLGWPVEGEILQEFCMDQTVYFPTLKQYKTNPAVLIGCEAGTTVRAAADGLVTAVGTNEEIGQFVTVDLGNGYALTYGQLQDVAVTPNQYVSAGDGLGILSTPTIYYVVEGDNLYLKMTKDGMPVDPLDYLQ